MLEATDVSAGYGQRLVLSGVSIRAGLGEVVAIVGPNGAGKSTLLKALFGLVRVRQGRVTLDGQDITNRDPAANVVAGVSYVPQGGRVFRNLSVRDNLAIGGYTLGSRREVDARRQEILELFPALRPRERLAAGRLSAGEAQMVALARALMLRPRVLLLDEPTLGLALPLAKAFLDTVRRLTEKLKPVVILVEQNVSEALAVSARTYVLRLGRIVLEGSTHELNGTEVLRKAFLV